jgi:hypothetical protein
LRISNFFALLSRPVSPESWPGKFMLGPLLRDLHHTTDWKTIVRAIV